MTWNAVESRRKQVIDILDMVLEILMLNTQDWETTSPHGTATKQAYTMCSMLFKNTV